MVLSAGVSHLNMTAMVEWRHLQMLTGIRRRISMKVDFGNLLHLLQRQEVCTDIIWIVREGVSQLQVQMVSLRMPTMVLTLCVWQQTLWDILRAICIIAWQI